MFVDIVICYSITMCYEVGCISIIPKFVINSTKIIEIEVHITTRLNPFTNNSYLNSIHISTKTKQTVKSSMCF